MRMTKRPVILVAFLLMLYIVPSLFIVSYGPSTILTQPNMQKEFSSSEYLDESPYSIDGFSETLPNDVFYTPDGWYDDEIMPATDGGPLGTGNWYEVESINGDGDDIGCWISDGDEYCQFNGKGYTIEGFDYRIYGRAQNGNASLVVPNVITGGWGCIINLTRSDVGGTYYWHNGTYFGPLSSINTRVSFFSNNDMDPSGVSVIDYMEIRFYYLPYLKTFSNHYTNWGTSFTNVSDWTLFTGNSPSSDGDVMTWPQVGDNLYDTLYTNSPSLSAIAHYIEFRVKSNTSTTYLQVQTYPSDSRVGTITGHYAAFVTTSWATFKLYTSKGIECLQFYAKDTTNPSDLQFDYIRISPADEMGFQHDMSTNFMFNEQANANFESNRTSDGDIITVNMQRNNTGATATQEFRIPYDTTSTVIDLETDYYQFIVVKYKVTAWTAQADDYIWFTCYIDGKIGATSLQDIVVRTNPSVDTIWQYARINLKGMTGSTSSKYISFGFRANDEGSYCQLQFDYVKIYSIANYTITDADDETVNDYLYVSGGQLRCSSVTTDYFRLDIDPTLAIDSSVYNCWNATIDYGLDGFRFRDGDGTYYDIGTANGTISSATLTSFQILFYDECLLTSIAFIDMHHWRTIDTIIFSFDLPEWHLVEQITVIFFLYISTATVDMWLAIAGMFLIPTSTCYLAYGGRKNFSTDKLFYGLVLFILGWGLLLGGIF